jgi:DNA-binding MarR family transcriptional regulator
MQQHPMENTPNTPPNPLQTSFDSAEDSPGFLLWQVGNVWQRRQREALAPLELTHVQFVLLASLAYLGKNLEPVTQIALAQHAQTDPMMTSQVLRTLEGKGLLERIPHPTDARAKSLKITHTGLELANRAVVVVEQMDRAFFAVLGEEVRGFVGIVQRLLK